MATIIVRLGARGDGADLRRIQEAIFDEFFSKNLPEEGFIIKEVGRAPRVSLSERVVPPPTARVSSTSIAGGESRGNMKTTMDER